jgi:hypothetical protein
MTVHAKRRSFEDPGVLRERASAWGEWHLRAPQWFRGRPGRPKGTGKSTARCDEAELAKALEELEAV